MLGSAIPKRWIVSLALVGLVSLFMASYAAVWSDSASASGGTIPGQVLTDIDGPSSVDLLTGQIVQVAISPLNEDGDEDLSMPDMIFSWNPGSCGTFGGATSTNPFNTFTAGNAACTGSIFVHGNQNFGPNVPSGGREILVNVFAPPTAPPAPPAPFDPPIIPVITPPGLTPGDVTVILPSTGGIFNLPNPSGPPTSLNVPGGALPNGTVNAVRIIPLSPSDVPPPPPPATEGSSSGTFLFGSQIRDIQWYDGAGTPLSTFKINKPAKVCMPFTQGDIDGAYNGPDGLAIYRHNGTDWVSLNSSVNFGTGTVCGNASRFSSFALGLAVAPPAEPGEGGAAGLPVTGGYTPGISSLVVALMAGFALVGGGVFTARRARRVREHF